MKKLLTLLFSLVATAAFSQAPAIQWQKSLGGSYANILSDLQQTADGGSITAGSAEAAGPSFATNFWIVKLDSVGTQQWQKTLGGTGNDVASAIQQTRDGGYIVAGYTASTDGDVTGNHGGYDYWVVKLDDTGAIEWQKALGGTKNDEAYSIRQTADGGYIVAGASYSNNGQVTGHHASTGTFDSSDFWIVKLNDTGAIQWQKSLGGSRNESAQSVQQTTDGGYIVAGYSESSNGNVTGNHGKMDYWLVKLDSAGILVSNKSLGGTGNDGAYGIQQTRDGGYALAGYTFSNDRDVSGNHGGGDSWIVKLDSTNAIQWQSAQGGLQDECAYSIQEIANGDYIVAGVVNTGTGGHSFTTSAWLARLSGGGNLQWQENLAGSGYDHANAVHPTADSGFIIGGSTRISGPHSGDFWVVKLAPDPTAVSTPTVAKGLSLFPNPANTEVRIQTNEAIRSVLLTDMNGKEVFRGGNTTVIPTAALANGLYLVRVQTANAVMTQKLVVQHP